MNSLACDDSGRRLLSTEPSHAVVGISSIIFVCVVLITVLMGQCLTVHNCQMLTESNASMIFGAAMGFLVSFLPVGSHERFVFHPQFFFFVLLPPIVFEAGFSMRRKHFFRNMRAIVLFATLGTIVSTIVIGLGMYLLAKKDLIPFDASNPLECLLFGSLISAVDPVGTLAILGKKELNVDPMLYSLIFGESVLNDAVSIVLFQTLDEYSSTDVIITFEQHFGLILGSFIGVFLGSLLIGCSMALLFSAFLRHSKLSHNTSIQFILVVICGYLSYNLSEVLRLSGIVSVFFCGICMAHYGWYNLTWISQISLHHLIKAFAKTSENFVYAYIGCSALLSRAFDIGFTWDANSIMFALALCALGRAVNIFPFSALSNCWRADKIHCRMQIMMWFSGLRGAIAFALALNMRTPNADIVVTTTLAVVILTTFGCGSFTSICLKCLGLQGPIVKRELNSIHLPEEPHLPTSPSMKTPVRSLERPLNQTPGSVSRDYSRVHKWWHDFDRKYMMPWFGGSSCPLIPKLEARQMLVDRIVSDLRKQSANVPLASDVNADASATSLQTMDLQIDDNRFSFGDSPLSGSEELSDKIPEVEIKTSLLEDL